MISSLLQKAGLRPGLALHSAIPKVLMAAAILGGAGSLLAPGSAQAANYQCAPRTAGATGGLFNIAFSSIAPQDTVTCGDKKYTTNSFDFTGYTGSIDFEWVVVDPPAGFARDQFIVSLTFDPVVGPKTGFFDYNVDILAPGYTFADVQLDSTVALDNIGTPVTTITKAVTSLPNLVSIDGLQIGPAAFSTPLTSITIRDTWAVASNDTLTNVKDTLRQQQVPGPLPLMGAGMAFGFSRKLRSRIKASAKAKA